MVKKVHALSNKEIPHPLLKVQSAKFMQQASEKYRHENKFYLSNYKNIPP